MGLGRRGMWTWKPYGRGEWRGNRGAGVYAVTYSRKGREWFASFVPWFGASQTFKSFKTRQEAQRWIEETF